MSTNPVFDRNGEAEATANGAVAGAGSTAASTTTNGVRPDSSLAAPSALDATTATDGAPTSGAAENVSGPYPSQPSALDVRAVTTPKDISLKDFLNKMDDYAPIVCDQKKLCLFFLVFYFLALY